MSKSEILAELPHLKAEERSQVFQRLCELQEDDLLQGVGPTEEEKKILNEALAEFERNREPRNPLARGLDADSFPETAVKPHVSIRPAAATDLTEARDWYDRQRPGLGDEFLASVADVLTRIEDSPEQFPVYFRNFRRAIDR